MKAPKRDRFGICIKIENLCLDILTDSIRAALSAQNEKLPFLVTARVDTEVLKRLTRITYELRIIPQNAYIALQTDLQEISKMVNGWIGYLTKRPAR